MTVPVQEMSGIAKNRQRSLAALGALTFGHVAKLPSMLLKQKFGIWGQQLWLFSNGQWNEPLVLEIKDRTTISSSTTLPQDEHDYEAALTFMLSRVHAVDRTIAAGKDASARIQRCRPVHEFYRSRHKPPFQTSAISKLRHQRGDGSNVS